MKGKNKYSLSSNSDDEIKTKIKEFGYDLKQAQRRADALLSELNQSKTQNSSYQHNFTRAYSPPKLFSNYKPKSSRYQPTQPLLQTQQVQQLKPATSFVYSQAQIQQPYIPTPPVQQIQQVQQTQSNAPLRESYLEYIPKEHTIIEYTPVQKIEYVPQERKVIDYEVVEHIIEKQPIKTYEKKIEYVPVERLQERIEYQISERTQLHQPLKTVTILFTLII